MTKSRDTSSAYVDQSTTTALPQTLKQHPRSLSHLCLSAGSQVPKLRVEIRNFLKEGVMTQEYVSDNIVKLMNTMRNTNVTIRWLMLHTHIDVSQLSSALTLYLRLHLSAYLFPFSPSQPLSVILCVNTCILSVKNFPICGLQFFCYCTFSLTVVLLIAAPP